MPPILERDTLPEIEYLSAVHAADHRPLVGKALCIIGGEWKGVATGSEQCGEIQFDRFCLQHSER